MSIILENKLVIIGHVQGKASLVSLVEEIIRTHEDACILCLGDFAPILPVMTSDVEGSVLQELYGGGVEAAVTDAVAVAGDAGKFAATRLYAMLRETVGVRGVKAEATRSLVGDHYNSTLAGAGSALGRARQAVVVPGVGDYGELLARVGRMRNVTVLDGTRVVQTRSGARVGVVSGGSRGGNVVATAFDHAPGYMAPAEFTRRLESLGPVDVLVTATSPQESPELAAYLRDGPAKLVLCVAALTREPSGKVAPRPSEIVEVHGKCCVLASPLGDQVSTFAVNLQPQALNSISLDAEFLGWKRPPSAQARIFPRVQLLTPERRALASSSGGNKRPTSVAVAAAAAAVAADSSGEIESPSPTSSPIPEEKANLSVSSGWGKTQHGQPTSERRGLLGINRRMTGGSK